jgi:hypothetical protein
MIIITTIVSRSFFAVMVTATALTMITAAAALLRTVVAVFAIELKK